MLNVYSLKILFFSRIFAEQQCSAEHILGNAALHYKIWNYLSNLSCLQRMIMPSWSTKNTNLSTVNTTFMSFSLWVSNTSLQNFRIYSVKPWNALHFFCRCFSAGPLRRFIFCYYPTLTTRTWVCQGVYRSSWRL